MSIKFEIKENLDKLYPILNEFSKYPTYFNINMQRESFYITLTNINMPPFLVLQAYDNFKSLQFYLDFRYNLAMLDKTKALNEIFLVNGNDFLIKNIDNIKINCLIKNKINPFIEEFFKRVKYSINLKYINLIETL
jgi:hypothetical protein